MKECRKIAVVLLFLISNLAIAQSLESKTDLTESRSMHNINFNLLGEGAIISINYEKLFFINPNLFLTGQIGLGYNEEFVLFSNGSPPDKFFIIPHHCTGNIGKKNHFFEFGLSGSIVSGNTNRKYLLGPIIGYRLQPLHANKVNLRVSASLPLIGLNTDIFYVPFGISVGINLN